MAKKRKKKKKKELYKLESLIDMKEDFKDTKDLILLSIVTDKVPDNILKDGVLPLVLMVEELLDQCVLHSEEISRLQCLKLRITNN